MGALLDLARSEPLYGRLLHLDKGSVPVFRRIREAAPEWDDLNQLLGPVGWRDNLVGAAACLFHPDRAAARQLLWDTFDTGSWVTPQLAILAMLLDDGDFKEVQRRLLLRCPVRTAHLDGSQGMWRHVVHGTSIVTRHEQKGMAALLASYARCPEGRSWLSSRLPVGEAFWALEIDDYDRGDDLARNLGDALRGILPELDLEVPAWLRGEVPSDLMGLWDLSDLPPAAQSLCRDGWTDRVHRLFKDLYESGHRAMWLEGDERSGRLVAPGLEGNRVLLELPFPYLIPGLWNRLLSLRDDDQTLWLREYSAQPTGLRVSVDGNRMRISLLEEDDRDLRPFRIVETPLQECSAQVLMVGIDSAGRLDGGAAQAVALAAGDSLRETLQAGLAQGGRGPGEVVVTDAFALRQRGVVDIAHVVTRPAPTVAELEKAVRRVLAYCHREHRRQLALPALGCGAGGLRPQEVAGPMLRVLAAAIPEIEVTLSLPRKSDREVFEQAARAQGLR